MNMKHGNIFLLEQCLCSSTEPGVDKVDRHHHIPEGQHVIILSGVDPGDVDALEYLMVWL
jgi:hypothetical protein